MADEAHDSMPLPTYGNFSCQPTTFYFDLIQNGRPQLLEMWKSIPQDERNGLGDAPISALIVGRIVELHHMESKPANSKLTDQQKYDKLLAMSPNQVKQMSTQNRDQLVELMQGALKANASLQPREISTDNAAQLSLQAMSWIWDNAHTRKQPRRKASLVLQHANTATHRQDNPQPIPEFPPPNIPLAKSSDSSDSSPLEIQPKKKKTKKEEEFNFIPKGYHLKRGPGSALFREKGKPIDHKDDLPILNVTEVIAPKALDHWLSSANSVEEMVRGITWYRRVDSKRTPSKSEIDALTYARIIDVEILTHRNAYEACLFRPSIEIAVRRLASLIQVEQEASSDISRKHACVSANLLLETFPTMRFHDMDYNDESINMMRKEKRRLESREALIKQIEKVKPKKKGQGKSNQRKEGTESSEGS